MQETIEEYCAPLLETMPKSTTQEKDEYSKVAKQEPKIIGLKIGKITIKTKRQEDDVKKEVTTVDQEEKLK